ncbi:MAG: protein kinase [Gemmatimonadetes bacterium]|nr:protein kinase [Gemmatimonadota bacterium]
MTAAGGRPEGDLMKDRVVAAIGDLYEIEAEIGRGGMAIVYRARDVKLRRKVAIKVLPPELAYRDDVRQRFVREAQTAAQLSHPNIVPIYAVDDRGGIVFFVMGLVEGPTLGQFLMREGHCGVPLVRTILRDVADALGYAHAHGVVHRDVKPDNILLDGPAMRAVVTDFGIARAAEGDARLTVTGVAVGTPAYMSPEQAVGEKEVDGRADLYALGVVGWQMLAGELPFKATNTPAMMMKHLSEAPPPLALRAPATPPNLVVAIEKAMAKKPDDRWQTAAEFRAAVAEEAIAGATSRVTPGSAPVIAPSPAPGGTQAPVPPMSLPDPIRNPVGFGVHVGVRVGEAVGGTVGGAISRVVADSVAQSIAGVRPLLPAPPANSPPLPPFPQYPTSGEAADREAWREARRKWREQVRAQGQAFRDQARAHAMMVREATRDGTLEKGDLMVGPDGRLAIRERPLEVRIASLRRKLVSNAFWSVALISINIITRVHFPWAIFPIIGMASALWRRYDALAADGVTWGDVMAGRNPKTGVAGGGIRSMAELRKRVTSFTRRAKMFGLSAVSAFATFAVGSTFNIDPLIPVFALSMFGTVAYGIGTVRAWLGMGEAGIGAGEALRGTWEESFHLNNPRLAGQLMAGEMDQAVPEEIRRGAYGPIVEGAAADRTAILDIIAKLGEADRALIPDVVPTVRALEERIQSLATALGRMEGTVGPGAAQALDRRIAALDAQGGGSAERERTRALLERQRQTLKDLGERQGTLRAQLDDAVLLLQTMKLDLFKLRSAGVQAALDDVTSATQEARALSREIGTVLEAADEVRRG